MQVINPDNWLLVRGEGSDGNSYQVWYFIENWDIELEDVDYTEPNDIEDMNGFIIQKVRETCSKTEYMTAKGDIQDIFVFNTTDKAKDRITSSLRSHEILVENIKLKQEIAKRNMEE